MIRAYTAEEMRQKLVDQMVVSAEYWARIAITKEEATKGLIHSICCIFDGVSGGLPAFNITPAPHESDQAYCEEIDENWWVPEVINDCYLHDSFYERL